MRFFQVTLASRLGMQTKQIIYNKQDPFRNEHHTNTVLLQVWGIFMKLRDFLLLLESYSAFEKSQLRKPNRGEGRHGFEEKLYLCPHVIFFRVKTFQEMSQHAQECPQPHSALGAVPAHPPGPLRAAWGTGYRKPSLGRFSKLEPRKVNLPLSS